MFDKDSLALFADAKRLTDAQIIKRWATHLARSVPELGDDELADVVSGWGVCRLPARSYWLKAGQSQTQMGVLVAGLGKLEYQDEQGGVVNVQFIQEGECVIEHRAFFDGEPCKYSMQTIEPSVILTIDQTHYHDCCQRYPFFYRHINDHLMQVLTQNADRIDNLLISDAQARYVKFIQENPTLATRLSVSDLSSYLRMSRQMLTHIRKKLGHRKGD
ncbi:Crp/Fnr family transcriptional regulator [Moraxella marmotae]|uniref:Crp/Fnr family transcriptional regulator n=1 Tax=Moraxella marmotae TaxID=3344520 RepID=UPI0035F31653